MSSTQPDADSALPVFKWLRVNLALLMFAISVISGTGGAVVAATMRIARYDFRLDTMERGRIILAERMDAVELRSRQRDADAEAAAKDISERRIKLARDLGDVYQRLGIVEQQAKQVAPLEIRVADDDVQFGALAGRIAVIETKTQWLGDFIKENFLPVPREKRR